MMVSFSKIAALTLLLIVLTACGTGKGHESLEKRDCAELSRMGATYLGGEDGGAWFLLSKEAGQEKNSYRIRSFYESTCELAWDGIFSLRGEGFDSSKPYEFIPLSSYEYCSIEQNGRVFRFDFIKENR